MDHTYSQFDTDLHRLRSASHHAWQAWWSGSSCAPWMRC